MCRLSDATGYRSSSVKSARDWYGHVPMPSDIPSCCCCCCCCCFLMSLSLPTPGIAEISFRDASMPISFCGERAARRLASSCWVKVEMETLTHTADKTMIRVMIRTKIPSHASGARPHNVFAAFLLRLPFVSETCTMVYWPFHILQLLSGGVGQCKSTIDCESGSLWK